MGKFFCGGKEPAVDPETAESYGGKKTGNRIIPFLLVVAVCLATGMLLGWLTGGRSAPPSEPKQAPLRLVFLGYPTLQAPAPPKAVWILSLDGSGGAEFTGISPALVVTTRLGQPAVLRDFLADPAGAPARVPQLDLFPQTAVVVEFDLQGFIVVVNRSGGVPIDGEYLDGQELAALLTGGDPDPVADLRLQLRVVRSMFAAGPCLSDSALAGLQPDHYLSTLSPSQLAAECRDRGPYLQGAVTFRIMDDVIPWQLPDGSVGLLAAE
jgi:hypothetical protein